MTAPAAVGRKLFAALPEAHDSSGASTDDDHPKII
jgi:hypothetical protein